MRARGADSKFPPVTSSPRGAQSQSKGQNYKIGSQLDEDSVSTMKIIKPSPYLTGNTGLGSIVGSIDDGYSMASRKPDAMKGSQYAASPRAKQGNIKTKNGNVISSHVKKKNDIDDLYSSLKMLAQSNLDSNSQRSNKFGYPMTLMESLTNSAIKDLVDSSLEEESRLVTFTMNMRV